MHPMKNANIISDEDMQVMFGRAEPLLLEHQKLLLDLVIARLDLATFFRVTMRLIDLLPLYTAYTSRFYE